MDADKDSFWPQLVPILRSICDATFVTIDLEMSGIPMKGYGSNDRSRLVGKPSLQELYEENREAAMKYQVLQVGITCIEEDRERGMFAA
jgi:poly(A)-specific ribonuclease